MSGAARLALSVVLPCHHATATVHRTVETLLEFLPTVASTWEVVVVDDGANTFDRDPLPDDQRIRLLRHDTNLGKGAAVRTGMLAARGDVRVFTDADLPYDRELIAVMRHYIAVQGFHLVVGDRTLPGSAYAPASGVRRLVSGLGAVIIGSLVTGGFHDTQCGIKAMRGDIADALFPLVRITGFAFDVEVIYLALKHGLDVKRIPVRLRRNESSSVRPVRDALRAARDIAAIKWHQVRGAYWSPELARLPAVEMAVIRSSIPPPTP